MFIKSKKPNSSGGLLPRTKPEAQLMRLCCYQKRKKQNDFREHFLFCSKTSVRHNFFHMKFFMLFYIKRDLFGDCTEFYNNFMHSCQLAFRIGIFKIISCAYRLALGSWGEKASAFSKNCRLALTTSQVTGSLAVTSASI